MRAYLDNCCFNRPFDDQSDLRVRVETEAKFLLQSLFRDGTAEYVWSDVLDYEASLPPFAGRAPLFAPWRDGAARHVSMDASIARRGAEIARCGVRKLDALHLASAEAAGCDWFFTTDKGILAKIQSLGRMRVANPVDFAMEGQP